MAPADGHLARIAVVRGVRGQHTIAPHRAGIAVEYNDRPTIVEFFSNTKWIPAIGEFGVLPLINATLMTSAIAILVALPLGLGAAIYLSEYATERVRKTLKPALEILAGIPTVVYGYFALTFMTPLLRAVFGVDVVNIYNTGAAGIVVGILIIPLVSSMSEDASARRAQRPARSLLRPGGNQAGDRDQGRGAGGAFRYPGRLHRGRVARHRRDDDRCHRGRRRAQLELQPL